MVCRLIVKSVKKGQEAVSILHELLMLHLITMGNCGLNEKRSQG
jgi:hypothetical protein